MGAIKLQEKEDPILQEKVYYIPTGPGLETYILPKKGYQKKYAVFSTHFGSIDNCFEVNGEIIRIPEGVAHFLEHKLFEDSQGDAFDRFAHLGASPNAYTSFTQTAYLFSSTEYFNENLETLLNFVQEPYFNEETVKKEQGIIEQEIRMYEDHPQWKVFFNLLEALYQKHPVKIDLAGTVDSIRQISPQVLYQCYYTFYHPCNMSLFVVGDVDPEKVALQVESNMQKKNFPLWQDIKRHYPEEPKEINKPRIEEKMIISNPLINIGFKDNLPAYFTGDELFRREIVTELLLDTIFGSSESLYHQLYEDDLIDENFEAGYIAETQFAYTLLGGETRAPDLLYQKIMEGIEKARKQGITKEQLERHRRKMMGQFIKRFNSLEFIANNYLSYRFKDIDFFAFSQILEEIALEEVHQRLEQHLQEGLQAVSVIYPRESNRSSAV